MVFYMCLFNLNFQFCLTCRYFKYHRSRRPKVRAKITIDGGWVRWQRPSDCLL